MNLPTRFLLLATLAFPVLAQDTAAPKPQGPLLVVKSAQPDVAMGLSMSLGSMDEVPELAAGSHYVITMGRDKQTTVTTAPGAVGFMEVTADPTGLMAAFADEVQQGRAMAQGMAGLALAELGTEPKDIAEMITGVFEFPNQLTKLTLVITGDPENVRETGMDVTLGLEAKADSAFAKMMAQLNPCTQGAPVLVGDNAMDMQMSIAPRSLQTLFAPMMDLILNMTFGAGEETKAARDLYRSWMDQYDGGLAFSFGEKGGMDILIGVLDGAKMAATLGSDDYIKMLGSQFANSRTMEMKVEPNALDYRGSKFHKMVTEMDGPPNPMMPDGKMTMFQGAVGNYVIVGGGEAATKAMADSVAEGKVKRSTLAGGAVMVMNMSMAKMAEMSGGGELPGDAPETMSMAIVPQGKDLVVKVHLK